MFLSKHKNGYYYVHYIDDITGKRNAISTKERYKPEAVKFLSDFKNNIKDKTKEKLKVHYLSELKTEVMQYVLNNMEFSTCKLYKAVFDNMFRIFDNKPLKLINTNDIELYKTVRAGEVTKATVNKDINTMKAIFNIAIRFEWLNSNPVKNIKKLSIPEKEYLAFTDVQIKMILGKIENVSIKNFVKFAILTGCRLNEIINLQWKDINFAERIFTIRNKPNFKTKTGKIRQIPISDSLYNLVSGMFNINEGEKILNFVNPERYIFENPNKYKYCKNYVSKYFKNVLRSLNFNEKYHFHCLRHTFITNLIKSGVNINYVKEIAGHSEIATTMNYIHISTNDLREAVNKINII
jgi:site-specific recombinase XerD